VLKPVVVFSSTFQSLDAGLWFTGDIINAGRRLLRRMTTTALLSRTSETELQEKVHAALSQNGMSAMKIYRNFPVKIRFFFLFYTV